MKILKLKLRGAIGIRKGLGKEEIEIDFSKFSKGLIALTGKNGSGKTTIMENLHPYRCMVSRPGSLQSHFYLKDSFRVLDFEHDGNLYQSKILIDALTGASEAYLFCNGEPLNDGKLTTYDEVIEKIIGSQDLFFNSVFSGQKSKGLAELKPADRRKLFYELLNLDIYEKYNEIAKEELKKNELILAEIEGNLRAININEDYISNVNLSKKELTSLLNNVKRDIEKCEQEKIEIERNINDCEIEISKLQEQEKRNEEIKVKINSVSEKIQKLNQHLNLKTIQYNNEISDYKRLVMRYKKIAANKDKIKDVLEEKKLIEEGISTSQSEKNKLQEKLSEYQISYSNELIEIDKLNSILVKKKNELQKLEFEFKTIQDKIDKSEFNIKIIDEVPCEPVVGAKCMFLTNAYESKNSLSNLKDKHNNYYKLITDKEKTIDKLTREIEQKKQMNEENFHLNSDKIKVEIDEIDSLIKKYEMQLKEIKKDDWEGLKSEADDAENQIKTYEEKILSTQVVLNEFQIYITNQINELNSEKEKLESEINNSILELINIQRDKIVSLNFTRNNLTDELKIKNDKMKEIEKNIYNIDNELNLIKNNLEKIKELNNQKISVNREIEEWAFLQRAFDKTGIPVLKLENSGIEITLLANELLSLFDNKFRIVFETTSLTKDKKKTKETFDIKIIDEDGVCEIENKSGGQQVYLETALRLAISNVIRNQGRKYQTSFLDEADGALDLDNAFNYIRMIQKAHDISGVYNTFIITHRNELLDYIPQQIKLEDGYLKILN